jgi:hypothetical protein
MAYRLTASGATDNRTFYLYGYSFAIDSSKTVQSITLPHNRNVVVLAVAVSSTGTVPLAAAAPSLSPAPGTYTAAQAITLSDSTPGAVIYYTTNGATPTTSSARYSAGTPLLVSSTTTINAMAVANNYSNDSAVIGATYTITPATRPPAAQTLQISGTPATSAAVGQFYSFTPTIVAPAGSSLTYAVANMPAWAQFSAATGTLSGTPTAGSAATDANILISVSNGATSALLPAFSIAVGPAVSAAAASGTASLSWTGPSQNTNGSPLTNLAGYVVLYGSNPTALNSQILVNSAGSTGVTIENLSPGNWYFEVAAVNTLNVQSQYSSIVSETIQ